MIAAALLATNTLLVIAVVIGFYKAWNIGANDVANSMGTVVGSGVLTLRQAICLASVFEFLGAILVGSHVTETIKGGIVSLDLFADQPMVFGLGMLSVALATAIWLNIATAMSHPVSVTQSTVGGIIGFAMVCAIGGTACVQWRQLGLVVLTWMISPALGGLGAYLMYRAIVRWVLKSADPLQKAKHAVPLGVAVTVSILFLSATYKGLPRITIDLPLHQLLGMTLVLALVLYVAARWVIAVRTRKAPTVGGDAYAAVEKWFGSLQVLTACYMAFAHGANDVSSAIGPLAGSMQAFRGQDLSLEVPASPWLLAFGGIGIVLGLSTYGYKVIATVGKKITEITPTRGFSAAFATATTVLVCSKLGLPISTTLTSVGAILGVGLARGFASLDLRIVREIFTSWIITVPISGFFTAVIYWIFLALCGV